MHTLLFIDRLELANFVGVIPPARRTFIVEIPPNVIPAEPANLWHNMAFIWLENKMKGGKRNQGSGNLGAHLVLALTRLEVEIRNIHLLEAERTLLCILHRTKDKGYVIN
jgi:hypothetical protein